MNQQRYNTVACSSGRETLLDTYSALVSTSVHLSEPLILPRTVWKYSGSFPGELSLSEEEVLSLLPINIDDSKASGSRAEC